MALRLRMSDRISVALYASLASAVSSPIDVRLGGQPCVVYQSMARRKASRSLLAR